MKVEHSVGSVWFGRVARFGQPYSVFVGLIPRGVMPVLPWTLIVNAEANLLPSYTITPHSTPTNIVVLRLHTKQKSLRTKQNLFLSNTVLKALRVD